MYFCWLYTSVAILGNKTLLLTMKGVTQKLASYKASLSTTVVRIPSHITHDSIPHDHWTLKDIEWQTKHEQ